MKKLLTSLLLLVGCADAIQNPTLPVVVGGAFALGTTACSFDSDPQVSAGCKGALLGEAVGVALTLGVLFIIIDNIEAK